MKLMSVGYLRGAFSNRNPVRLVTGGADYMFGGLLYTIKYRKTNRRSFLRAFLRAFLAFLRAFLTFSHIFVPLFSYFYLDKSFVYTI